MRTWFWQHLMCSPYPSIPLTADLEALTHYLSTRPTNIQPPNEFLLTWTDIILSNNFLQYAGSYFLQGRGVMGSVFTPSYACLVTDFWEERFIYSSDNLFHSKVVLWKRYIDILYMGLKKNWIILLCMSIPSLIFYLSQLNMTLIKLTF